MAIEGAGDEQSGKTNVGELFLSVNLVDRDALQGIWKALQIHSNGPLCKNWQSNRKDLTTDHGPSI
jgi:hypothetical protein